MNSALQYKISFTQPHKRFVDIEVNIGVNNPTDYLCFDIASWRPGRYELQNYAKNIHSLTVENERGEDLPFKKTQINTWQIATVGVCNVVIKYKYYANQMDAGGCWLDEQQLYLNFIACLVYPQGGLHGSGSLSIILPETYKIACGLAFDNNNCTRFSDLGLLFDSPAMASATLEQYQYHLSGCNFNIWIQGKHKLDKSKLLSDFQKFTQVQLDLFGEFPFEDYHFILQLLPYRHYHGVEHRNSTVIVLGPGLEVHQPPLYDELLGISSHELLHAWNVCKIRPVEMMPYDFSKPALFETGFVAEGFTTYFGDVMLAKSGVFAPERYLQEFNKTLKRHFQNFGNSNLSLANSSLELWIDGYVSGIPHRKVSIYVKGSVVAWLLDLTIQKESAGRYSLETVMKAMWERYGKRGIGFTVANVFDLVNEFGGSRATAFLKIGLYEVTDLKDQLIELASHFNIALATHFPAGIWERKYGIKLSKHELGWMVEDIAPNCPADKCLDRKDIIVNEHQLDIDTFFGREGGLEVGIVRDEVYLKGFLEKGNSDYWSWVEVVTP